MGLSRGHGSKMPMRRFRWMLAVAASCVSVPAWAQSEADPATPAASSVVSAPARSRPGVWEAGAGSRLRRGMVETSLSGGAGFGVRAFGSHARHDLALVQVGYGRSLGRNWELVAELFDGVQFRPRHRSLFGATPLLRYNFTMGGRWVAFVDGGAGPTLTSIRERDLSTTFEFNVQLGIGARYFLGENRAITLQYRWLHLSNAGMKLPNNGANTEMLSAGLSWFH